MRDKIKLAALAAIFLLLLWHSQRILETWASLTAGASCWEVHVPSERIGDVKIGDLAGRPAQLVVVTSSRSDARRWAALYWQAHEIDDARAIAAAATVAMGRDWQGYLAGQRHAILRPPDEKVPELQISAPYLGSMVPVEKIDVDSGRIVYQVPAVEVTR